ncbi:hypothetical protein VF21_01107 [Pseudogymnoascus sp. 05NY08]|nr:hypothetical protein VF21_01107 [Pseudogymnoascus sp. 05NY08]
MSDICVEACPSNASYSDSFGAFLSNHDMAVASHLVVTDLNVIVSPTAAPPTSDPKWHRIEKDLYLHTSQQSAWLYVALADEEELRAAEDLVVVNISVGERPPTSSGPSWESRPCGIWVLRRKFSTIDEAVTEVDVLFGVDAVDPRPQWALMQSPLQLETQPKVPVARLSVLCGRAPISDTPAALRVGVDGKFKILQISDTHMVTGVGVCRDAIDAHGNDLPDSDADPLTVKFIGNILDVEKPDLVVLSGDQLHHDVKDSPTAIYKLFAPIVERSTPFAVVFGNHDSEGEHALGREKQMSILQNLPFSFCRPGPPNVDGVGNYYLQVLAPGQSPLPLSTLYFLDSHGQISETAGYDYIKQSQIEWFTETSQAARMAREQDDNNGRFHLSLAFLHIPLPEFGDSNLIIGNGHRGEPTEGPKSIAEETHKPLYPITSGELRTDVVQTDQSLRRIFTRAKTWNAILLLDEADVFLAKRDRADLQRNAFVSVFLRLIEYYQGILFLVTNRVDEFDEAFQSRIRLTIHYQPLDDVQRTAIWRNLLGRIESKTWNEDILKKLGQSYKINGREINNLIRTAAALAEYEEVALAERHIETVHGLNTMVQPIYPEESTSRVHINPFKWRAMEWWFDSTTKLLVAA